MVAELRCDATVAAAMRSCSEEGQNGGLENHHRSVMMRQQILVNGRCITVAGGSAKYIRKSIMSSAQRKRKMDVNVAAGSLDIRRGRENSNEEMVDVLVLQAAPCCRNLDPEYGTLDNETSQQLRIGAGIGDTKDDICLPMSVKIERHVDEDEQRVNMAMQDTLDELHKNQLTNLDTSEGVNINKDALDGTNELEGMHKDAIPLAGTEESKVFYYKM